LIKHRNHHLKNIKVDSKQENFPINYTYVKPAIYWLVVSTSLKNISQWEGLSHILWKIENVPNQQPEKCLLYLTSKNIMNGSARLIDWTHPRHQCAGG
jgi:hypothetical protein